MSVLVALLLTGALLSNLVMPIPKQKPKGLPRNIDWSKVVH